MGLAWLFYALIALFFGYLLFDAFGKPVGRSKPEPRKGKSDGRAQGEEASSAGDGAYQPYSYSGEAPSDDEFTLDEKYTAPNADRALVEAGVRDIMDADERFELQRFMGNATRTLELVLSAYQDRDREQLQLLLQTELNDAFDGAITAAEEAGDNSKLELVGLSEPRLIDAKMEDTNSVVTLVTRLEQLISKRDKDGADVEGLGETVIETSEYTFVRDVNSSAPNWYLRSIEDA